MVSVVLERRESLQQPQAIVGRTTFEMFCTIAVSGASQSQSKTSNSSPKSQNNCLKMRRSSVFVSVQVCSIQFFDVLRSPTQSFGVGYDKLDSLCVTEIPKTLLIGQRGLSEDHHLETEDKSTLSTTTGNYSAM